MLSTRRFHLSHGQSFADQYYYIYNARLEWARSRLIDKAKIAWGQVRYVPLEELNSSLGTTEVFVLGTLFKVMQKQYSILRDSQEPQDNLTSDDDTLILHETDENVQVVGNIDIHSHITGIPIALLGYQVDNGAKFHITSLCYAGLDLSVYSLAEKNGYKKSQADKVIILSGIHFGADPKTESRLANALKKLRDYLMDKSNCVVKTIIAGNSVAPGSTRAKAELIGSEENRENKSIVEVFGLVDRFVYTLAQSGADIDIMPGKNDPTSYLLPQQPFHPKILPRSGVLSNVHPVTNPCILPHKNITMLGTSGENIQAVMQHTRIEFSTTALKSTLEWGHMAPSAPDNLSCFPFKEKDPFVIDFEPDIYFAGNQPEYAVTTYSTSTKSKIQLVSVPIFETHLSCVSIDLTTLDAELMNFSD